MKANKKVIIILPVVIIIISVTVILLNLKSDKSSATDIIGIFDSNFNRFNIITTFLVEDEGAIYANTSTGKLRIEYTKANGFQDSKTGNKAVDAEISYIINKMGFIGIYEGNEKISFVKEAANPEKGVIYMKNNKIPSGPHRVEKLKENWYYYEDMKE